MGALENRVVSLLAWGGSAATSCAVHLAGYFGMGAQKARTLAGPGPRVWFGVKGFGVCCLGCVYGVSAVFLRNTYTF